jgi:hypothetical protein
MNYLYETIFETFEYYINDKIKELKSYNDVKKFIEKCILELEIIDETYLLNDTITTKTNYTYYINHIKKKTISKYLYNESNINDIMTYCKRVSFIENHIQSNSSYISLYELLEYYYVAQLYFHKYIFIKCLKNYIYMISKNMKNLKIYNIFQMLHQTVHQ